MRQCRVALFLALIVLLAFVVRSLGFETTFVGDGEVVFWPGDPAYHARLALYSLVNFPSVLTFDPYLNFPHGSAVPVPPLYDLLMAALARALDGSVRTLEHVMAWAPPLLGALTALPVYAATRCIAGPTVALGAAALYALLNVAAVHASVGYADHHAAVSLLGAILLALSLTALRGVTGRHALARLTLGLALTRAALLFTWQGSLLYLGLASVSLLVAGALGPRRDLLRVEATSAALAALLAAPGVAALGAPAGATFSATSLSWFHVVSLVGAAVVAASLLVAQERRPAASSGTRLVRLVGAAAAAGALALLVPGLRSGIEPVVEFMGAGGELGHLIGEQRPLFDAPRRAVTYYGYLAFAIPLAPFAALLAARDPRARAPALALAGWSAVLGFLAVSHGRYGNDFAPAACASFALALGWLAARGQRALRLPRAGAALLAIVAGVALLYPSVTRQYLPKLRGSLTHLAGRGDGADRALATAAGSLSRFTRAVREATPETAGFLDDRGAPDYGVLSTPNLGHALRYGARRPTTVDGFWETIDPESFGRVDAFLRLTSEDEAVALAAQLRARYVVTPAIPGVQPGTLLHRLHREDGLGVDRRPRWKHFRLITEGPEGGRPLSDVHGAARARRVIPYKLFEVVEGALLEVHASPGAPVQATLLVRTPLARRFVYRAQAVADAIGIAELRVPYPTQATAPVQAVGPYTVRVEGREVRIEISEDEVRTGAVVVVDPPAQES